MSELIVKICGVRSPEVGLTARAAGADLIGLIFAPSKRTVTVEDAAGIIDAIRTSARDPERSEAVSKSRLRATQGDLSLDEGQSGRSLLSRDDEGQGDSNQVAIPRVVGVFVDETADRLTEIGERLDLDFIQLSGDEPPSILSEVGRPVIKALRLPAGMEFDQAAREADRYFDAPVPARALLLDAHVAGSYGGNGVVGNWTLAARLAERYPILLAGGLNPGNVSAAIDAVHPLGVDVSSGVETDGVKDHDKIRQFVSVARSVEFRHEHQSQPLGDAFRLHVRHTV